MMEKPVLATELQAATQGKAANGLLRLAGRALRMRV